MQQEVANLPNRSGETGAIPFRTGRLFNVGPLWYYATREGDDAGPFISKELAETSLKSYLHEHGATESDN